MENKRKNNSVFIFVGRYKSIMKKILVIEEDTILNLGVCYNLELIDYRAIPAYGVEIALKILEIEEVDLIVLDVNLIKSNEFYTKIRRTWNIPIVFLVDSDIELEVKEKYELCKEEFILKPCNIHVLCKNIESFLKKCERDKLKKIYTYRNLTINFNKMEVEKDNISIMITPTEDKILKLLITNPKKVLTRKDILEQLWDQDDKLVDEHTLTVHMNRLRNKIESKNHKYIKTLYGLGYMWIGEE